MSRNFLLCLTLLVSSNCLSEAPKPGDTLPELLISELGEIHLSDDEFSYRPWQYPRESGQVHIVQYLAATMSASNLNKPFTDRLSAELSGQGYHVTTVINMDEAMWGTSGFVVSEVKGNKRRYPASTMVLDKEGLGRETWQLESDSSAILILDGNGVVQYLKQGAMSDVEINSALDLIRQHLAQETS